MKKQFVIEQEHLDILKETREKNNLRDDSMTLRFILESYKKSLDQETQKQEFILQMLDAYQERYHAFFERLRWATRTAEQNSTVLMDIVNTHLIQNHTEDCIPMDVMKSPAIEMSEKVYKDKIVHFKQMKDNRKKEKEQK